MNVFSDFSRTELLHRVGDISQFAGAKRYFLADGRGIGTECVDIKTGSGFEYTVMPGRGMDIGWCGYKGIPISYISKVGYSSSAFFTGVKDQWRQCFPGGMLSTCGLSNVGTFCEDDNPGIGTQDFGQHGRISNQCAYNVGIEEEWKNNEFEISITGKVREAQLRAENFSLKRTIKSFGGKSYLTIDDDISNDDFIDRPIMYLYHMNFGFPIIGPASSVLFNNQQLITDIEGGSTDISDASIIGNPINGMKEKLYFFESADSNTSCIAIINNELGLLVYVKYSSSSLNFLTEWKMQAEADYVIGLETGNCIPKGRKYHREHNKLPTLKAGEQIHNSITIGVIDNEHLIKEFIIDNNLK